MVYYRNLTHHEKSHIYKSFLNDLQENRYTLETFEP